MRVLITLLLLTAALGTQARDLPDSTLHKVDSLIEAGYRNGYYPGATVVVGQRNKVLYRKYVGYCDTTRTARVAQGDVYDLASLTKVVATTLSVMNLYDDRLIDLNATVGSYLDLYDDSEISKIPVSQLLTHTSGLPFFAIYPMLFHNPDPESRLISTRYDKEKYPVKVDRAAYICREPLADSILVSRVPMQGFRRAGDSIWVSPSIDSCITAKIIESYKADLRGKYRYSDTNFHILRQIVERITSRPLDSVAADIFQRMGMNATGYRPLEWADPEVIIPTEVDLLMGRGLVKGYPHDELAAVSDRSVGGNAGLFSTAEDLARFCSMMLSRGTIDGERIISRETVALFTSSPLEPKKIYRGLGFDKRDSESPLKGYGHTGYTGTMIWIDPASDIYMVFLSNRVHPTRLSTGLSASSLRTRIWEALLNARAQ